MKVKINMDLEHAPRGRDMSNLIYMRLMKKSRGIEKRYNVISSIGFFGRCSLDMTLEGDGNDLKDAEADIMEELDEWFGDDRKYTEKDMKKMTVREKVAALRGKISKGTKQRSISAIGKVGIKISKEVIE